MGCEHAQAAGGQTSPSQFEENTLSEVKRVIAVLSGKGGVGKSFVTGAIATELARHGHKVGVLDADITGPSIPKMFGMSGRHVHALGNLMLPEISERGVKVMSSNLLLQNETDPVLWRGPVIAGAIRQFWSETSWGPIDLVSAGTGEMRKRYGFIHVDKYDDGTGTYERRRKDSFFAYQKIIKSNGAEGLE